jgi:hypothetical protein
VSEVVETDAGFELLRHDAERPRAAYAYQQLIVPYLEAPRRDIRATLSRSAAADLANALLAEVGPARPLELAADGCGQAGCTSSTQNAQEGSGHGAIEQAILHAEVGELVPRVFETPAGFVLVRREPTPSPEAGDAWRSELPGPPPIETLVQSMPPDVLAQGTRALARRVVQELGVEPAGAALAVFDRLADAFAELPPEARTASMREARTQLDEAVGKRLAEQIDASMRSQLGELVFAPPPEVRP